MQDTASFPTGTFSKMRYRPVKRPDDMAALDELFEIVHESDGHRPIGEHKYLDLLHADPERATGLVAVEDDEIVGYLAVTQTQQPEVWAMEIALHPMHRSLGDIRSILHAGVERAGPGARLLRMWAYQPRYVQVLDEMGFETERELRQLRRRLPLDERFEMPRGIDVRSFRPGVDDDVWLQVNNAAFAGHPENGAWTREILEDRKRQDWFDVDGFRMAWEGDELVGFCWTKMHEGAVGEIYVIAVAPAHRRRGIGAALVSDGLRYLEGERGAEVGMLYVDADNLTANALYGRLGFRLDHVDRALVKRL